MSRKGSYADPTKSSTQKVRPRAGSIIAAEHARRHSRGNSQSSMSGSKPDSKSFSSSEASPPVPSTPHRPNPTSSTAANTHTSPTPGITSPHPAPVHPILDLKVVNPPALTITSQSNPSASAATTAGPAVHANEPVVEKLRCLLCKKEYTSTPPGPGQLRRVPSAKNINPVLKARMEMFEVGPETRNTLPQGGQLCPKCVEREGGMEPVHKGSS